MPYEGTRLSETSPTPTRRKFWPVVLVVVLLLALTTWDVLRRPDGANGLALRRAAFDGNEIVVQRILKAHPDLINCTGSTNQHLGFLTQLYDRGAYALGNPPPSPFGSTKDADAQFRDLEGLGATPLFHAMAGRNLTVAKMLAGLGADVRTQLKNGFTLAAPATLLGDTNFLAELVQRGIKLEVRDPKTQHTLLHYAVLNNHAEMATLLIRRGLEVDATNKFGITPLQLAVGKSHLETVQLLATNGADPNHVDRTGNTPLSLAVARVTGTPFASAKAVLAWLEAFAATNKPPTKNAP